MNPKGLEWAQGLRGELLTRIGQLKVTLAEIEPLRQDLQRMEAQLEGVDRLIAVYADWQDAAAETPALAGSQAIVPREQTPPLPLGRAARELARAARAEAARLLARWRETIRLATLGVRLRLASLLIGQRQQS